MPALCTRSCSPVPPQTREGPCDEKWAFGGKQEKHCEPEDLADAAQGDNWDHVGLAPEHRLVVRVGPGKRTAEKVEKLVHDFTTRTGSRPMTLMTSDESPAYTPAILDASGQAVVPPRTGHPGRPK